MTNPIKNIKMLPCAVGFPTPPDYDRPRWSVFLMIGDIPQLIEAEDEKALAEGVGEMILRRSRAYCTEGTER